MILIHTWGSSALFADPHFRADPFSYPVMTPSAAKGLLRSIYWKPEFEWEIAWIRVLNPIRYDNYKVKSIQNARAVNTPEKDRTLQTLSVLVDVSYVVAARIVLNPLRTKAPHAKYLGECVDRMKAGEQFRQPHFGRREFTANYEFIDRGDRVPDAIPVMRDIGSMLFDLVPIDLGAHGDSKHPDKLEPVFFPARLESGVLNVPQSLYDQYRDRIFNVRAKAHKAPEVSHAA